MRPQSPKFFQTQTIATTRVVSSPPRDKRNDSCGRLAKVTTYQSRPKATVTTTTYRPVIETRTVKLCTEKKCSGHETLIEQLTQENNKLNQRLNELQNDLDVQIEKYDSEQQVWSMKQLQEETKKNHKQEVSYLNSELNTFKSQFQYQDDQIRFLTSQLKQQEVLENKIALLTTEIERLQYVIEDKNQLNSQQTFTIQDYEKQLQVGHNVIEERNQQIQNLESKFKHYEQELIFSNNIIDELKFEITQKDQQTQQLLAQKDSLMQTFRENLELLENKISQLQQNEQLKEEQISFLQQDIDNLKNQIHQLENELNDQREQNFQLNQQVIINDQTNENLQNQLTQQFKEYQDQLSDKDSENELIKKERSALLNQQKQNQEELQVKNQEIEDLKIKNSTLILQLEETCNQLNHLSEKLEKTENNQNELINSQLLNYQRLEQQNIELRDNINLQQESLQQVEQQLVEQKEFNRQLQDQVSGLEREKNEFESRNNILEIDNKSQQMLAEDLKNQLKQELMNLKQEKDNLLQQNQDLELTLSNLQQKLSEQITNLQSQIDNHIINVDSLREDKLNLIQQILLQCFQIQRLNNQNIQNQEQLNSQEDKLVQLEKSKQKYEEDVQKLKESSILNSQKQEIQLQQLQQSIDGYIEQVDSLQHNLKYQNSLVEELNKKNHFQQQQISHLQDVEQQLKYLNEQTNLQAKSLSKELESKSDSESSLRFKLDKLLEELKIKQMQLVELDSQMRQMEQNNNAELTNLEERNSYLQNEVETWKQKFSILNKDYHRVQEDLMMLQAEFDAYKRRGQDIKNVKESTYFEVRKSSLYKENIDIKGSQTSISKLFKENI